MFTMAFNKASAQDGEFVSYFLVDSLQQLIICDG